MFIIGFLLNVYGYTGYANKNERGAFNTVKMVIK